MRKQINSLEEVILETQGVVDLLLMKLYIYEIHGFYFSQSGTIKENRKEGKKGDID